MRVRAVASALALLLLLSCQAHEAHPRVTVSPAQGSGWPHELWVAETGSDDGPGQQDRPFRQITRAAAVARPGTVVHVAAGVYAAVQSARSGTAEAPIAFRSEPPGSARVEAGGAVSAWVNTGDWVDIEGFDLSGARYNGLLSTGSHGRFSHNHVHDIRAPSCSRGGAGIVVESYRAIDNITSANLVEHVTSPGACARVHGIYYQSPHGGRIENNVVVACTGWGIHLWHDASHITIINNTVVGNGRGGIAVGGSLEGNDRPPGIASGVVVANNIVVSNGQVGISELGRVGRNTFVRNLSEGNAFADYQVRGRVTEPVTGPPDFVAADDFHLGVGSVAIDAGVRADAPDQDFDGHPRPLGPGIDLGAYEAAP